MIDQTIAELLSDLALKALYFLVLKLNHFAAAHIDQVIVVFFGRFLVPRAAMTEIMTLQHVGLLEQTNGTVDRCQADSGVDLNRSLIDGVGIRMVVRFRQNLRNNAALFGHFQPFFKGKLFNA